MSALKWIDASEMCGSGWCLAETPFDYDRGYIVYVDDDGGLSEWDVWRDVDTELDAGPETGRAGRRIGLRRAVELGVIPEADAREIDDPDGGKTWGVQVRIDERSDHEVACDRLRAKGYADAIADVVAYLDAEADCAPCDRDGDVLREAATRIDAGDAKGAAND